MKQLLHNETEPESRSNVNNIETATAAETEDSFLSFNQSVLLEKHVAQTNFSIAHDISKYLRSPMYGKVNPLVLWRESERTPLPNTTQYMVIDLIYINIY